MTRHKGLITAIALGMLIVAALLYMFFSLTGEKKSELIYVVSKTSSENSTFWHSVERGVKVAADELGVEVVFVGPEREIDLDHQMSLVEEGIEMNPLAIVLAASDYNALAPVSEKVIEEKIPLIMMDSDVNIGVDHSFIATNSILAGQLIGQRMGSIVGEGQVAMVSHLEGTTSAIDREEGFRRGIGDFEEIHLIDEVPYSNNDAGIAYDKTRQLVVKYPDIRGIFGTNEATLIGIARAVDELGLRDQISVVGFDISDKAAAYMEKDIIDTIVIQRPFNMGYLSIKEAYNQAKRGKNPEKVDVDIVLVTKDNMFDEEIQKFLIPFLE